MSLKAEEKIKRIREDLAIRLDKIASECTGILAGMGQKEFEKKNDLTAELKSNLEKARVKMHDRAITSLMSDEIISALPPGSIDESDMDGLRLSVSSLLPEPDLPLPEVEIKMSPLRLAASAAMGSLAGIILLGSFLHHFMDMRETGMLLGAPLGAAATVYALWLAAQNNFFRKALISLVGAGAVTDALFVFTQFGYGGIWNKLRGNGGFFKRMLTYIALIALLVFVRPTYGWDAPKYREMVEYLTRQWIDCGVLLLIDLTTQPPEQPREAGLSDEMARSILNLHRSSQDHLPDNAEEVIQQARNLKMNGLEDAPAFVSGDLPAKREIQWHSDLAERYRTFGSIDEGDLVSIEEEPVIQDGTVSSQGLVRKVRKKHKWE